MLTEGTPLSGVCLDWSGLICQASVQPNSNAWAACDGQTLDDPCTVWVAGVQLQAGCLSWQGSEQYYCGLDLTGEQGGYGRLDGITVDACGYVYVTEYVQGHVWRISPDGAQVERVATLPSSWIPNLHFGEGIGGWDNTTLYVADRDEGRMFAIPIGIPGTARVFPQHN